MALQDNIIWTDLDLTFQLHPVKKDLVLSTNDLAITRAVKNLVLTNHYESPFHPEIGSNIRAMLFEPATPLTAAFIQQEIKNTIQNFEPRVKLINISVETSQDENSYEVTIQYYIENQAIPSIVTFLLERTR